jgi:hypothetical protein
MTKKEAESILHMMMMEKPPERRRSTRHSFIYIRKNFKGEITSDIIRQTHDDISLFGDEHDVTIHTPTHSFTIRHRGLENFLTLFICDHTRDIPHFDTFHLWTKKSPAYRLRWILKSFLPDSHPILPIPSDEAIFYKDIISKN